MASVKGTVEATSNKFDKYSILVNGQWYSSKFEVKANRGDEVEFDSGDTGKYVRKLRVTGRGSGGGAPSRGTGGAPSASRVPGFPVQTDTKDRSIVRQNSLGHAVKLVSTLVGQTEADDWSARESSTEEIAKLCVDVARIFEDYSAGDSDAEEAAALVEGSE